MPPRRDAPPGGNTPPTNGAPPGGEARPVPPSHSATSDDPGDSSYLKVDMTELGDQLGVRAEELVAALRAHEGAVEYGQHGGGGGERGSSASRLPSAVPTPSAVPGTPTDAPFSPRQASGWVVFVQGEEMAETPTTGPTGNLSEVDWLPPGESLVEAESFPMAGLMDDLICSMQQEDGDLAQVSAEESLLSPRRRSRSRIPSRTASRLLPDLEAPLLASRRESFDEADIIGTVSLPSAGSAAAEEAHLQSGFLFKVTDGGAAAMRADAMEPEGGELAPGTPPATICSLMEHELQAEREMETAAAGTPFAAGRGDTYAFAMPDMGGAADPQVTFKSLALPSDITSVELKASEAAGGAEGEVMPQLQLTVQRRSPVIGYVLLALAVWGVSALGAGVRMLGDVHPLVKSLWRCELAFLVFTPWLAATAFTNPQCFECLRDMRTIGCFLLTAVSSAGYAGLFVMSLTYTTMATAFLLGNCHSLLIVSWRLITGSKVSAMEGLGVFIGLAGAAITVLDKEKPPAPTGPPMLVGPFGPVEVDRETFGAGLALASGVCGALYITSAGMTRPRMEFSAFLWLLFLAHAGIYALMLALLALLEGQPLSALLSMGADPLTGFFGWLAPANLWPVMGCRDVGVAVCFHDPHRGPLLHKVSDTESSYLSPDCVLLPSRQGNGLRQVADVTTLKAGTRAFGLYKDTFGFGFYSGTLERIQEPSKLLKGMVQSACCGAEAPDLAPGPYTFLISTNPKTTKANPWGKFLKHSDVFDAKNNGTMRWFVELVDINHSTLMFMGQADLLKAFLDAGTVVTMHDSAKKAYQHGHSEPVFAPEQEISIWKQKPGGQDDWYRSLTHYPEARVTSAANAIPVDGQKREASLCRDGVVLQARDDTMAHDPPLNAATHIDIMERLSHIEKDIFAIKEQRAVLTTYTKEEVDKMVADAAETTHRKAEELVDNLLHNLQRVLGDRDKVADNIFQELRESTKAAICKIRDEVAIILGVPASPQVAHARNAKRSRENGGTQAQVDAVCGKPRTPNPSGAQRHSGKPARIGKKQCGSNAMQLEDRAMLTHNPSEEAGKKGICGLCGLSAKLKTCGCTSGPGFCLDCLYVHMQVPGENLFAELSQMYPKEKKAWLKDKLESCDHVPLHVAHAVKQKMCIVCSKRGVLKACCKCKDNVHMHPKCFAKHVAQETL